MCIEVALENRTALYTEKLGCTAVGVAFSKLKLSENLPTFKRAEALRVVLNFVRLGCREHALDIMRSPDHRTGNPAAGDLESIDIRAQSIGLFC